MLCRWGLILLSALAFLYTRTDAQSDTACQLGVDRYRLNEVFTWFTTSNTCVEATCVGNNKYRIRACPQIIYPEDWLDASGTSIEYPSCCPKQKGPPVRSGTCTVKGRAVPAGTQRTGTCKLEFCMGNDQWEAAECKEPVPLSGFVIFKGESVDKGFPRCCKTYGRNELHLRSAPAGSKTDEFPN